MAKKITGIPVKIIGDKFKSVELNEIVSVVNDNANTLDAAGGGFIARVAPSFSFAGKEKGIYKVNAIGTYGTTGTGQVIVDDITSKSWSLYWNGTTLSGDFVSIDTTSLATKTELNAVNAQVVNKADVHGPVNTLDSVFVDNRTLDKGTFTDGRLTNLASADTNASYKKSDFIAVHPSWILSFNRNKDANSWHVMYDEFKKPLGRLNPVLNTDTSLLPRTRYIRLSDLSGNMTGLTITIKNAISVPLSSVIKITEEISTNEQSAVANYFNWQDIIPAATISTTGDVITNIASIRTTPFMKLKEGHSGWLVVAPIYNSINSWAIAFYRADGSWISTVSMPAGGIAVVPLFGPQWRYGEVQVPAESVYFRLRWDHRTENTDAQLQSIRIVDRNDWRIFVSQSFFSGTLNSARVKDIILSERIIDNSLANKSVYKLGDSITANNMGEGSWNIWFNGALRPRSIVNKAVGGATLTSSANFFGPEYLNDGNTFLKYAEQLYRDIEAGTIPPPDILMIMGGTNDFDNTNKSFVTPAELTASGLPYDEYMESTFFTNSPTYNTLKPLTSVPRSKVAGALRYIVERIGTISPNTIFIICTPIQSTLHDQLNAQRVVRDIKWISNRMSIPIIDQWNASGMPMMWDYGTDRRFLGDRVHPFTDSGQTRGSAVMGRFVSSEFLKIFIPNV